MLAGTRLNKQTILQPVAEATDDERGLPGGRGIGRGWGGR